jgi:hypothetical protein
MEGEREFVSSKAVPTLSGSDVDWVPFRDSFEAFATVNGVGDILWRSAAEWKRMALITYPRSASEDAAIHRERVGYLYEGLNAKLHGYLQQATA